MRAAGVEPVVRSESLAVVGLVEVLRHIPRIYGEYRKLVRALRERRPELVVLTDSPDFHLRVASEAARLGIPVIYLVAPQVWAWRKDRIPQMRRVLSELLCIFPFEKQFFKNHGIPATFIGHPLVGRIAPSVGKAEYLQRHGIPADRPLVALLPGSRPGEAARHLPALLDASRLLARERNAVFVLPASSTTGPQFFRERIAQRQKSRERNPVPSIHITEGQAWDALAHADVALAASGTVTVEAALLGTPTVVFYRVTPVSWMLGKLLVRVPFYCMVNLVAGRRVFPELMQGNMSPERLAAEAGSLLDDPLRREQMRADLAEVAARLHGPGDAIETAARVILEFAARSDKGESIGSVC